MRCNQWSASLVLIHLEVIHDVSNVFQVVVVVLDNVDPHDQEEHAE